MEAAFIGPEFPVCLNQNSRLCPDQKGHSPGYSVNNFGTKRQRTSSKFAGVQNVGKIILIQYWNVVYLNIPDFMPNFLFCPGFISFWDKFQAISGLGQIKFKFPGSAGNPVVQPMLNGKSEIRAYILKFVPDKSLNWKQSFCNKV